MTDTPEANQAFAGLYDRNFAKVYNYVSYRLGDPAAGPVEAWLFGIARNAVAERPGREPKSEDVLVSDESRRDLRRAVLKLRSALREP